MGLGSGSGRLGCGAVCMKYLLFIFNFIFFLSGAAILGIAIWIKVDPEINDYLEIINWDEDVDLYSAASWILVAVGAFIFLVGFCGCCGACRESTCLLQTYAALMFIVLLLEVVAAILAVVYSSQLEEEIEGRMKDQVEDHILGNNEDREKDLVTKAWDSLQENLKCCGAAGPNDYDGSRFQSNSLELELVPKTCCRSSDTPDYIQCNAEVGDPGNAVILYTDGCYTKIIDWMKDNTAIMIGVGFGLAALEILGIVFACCVSSGIKKDHGYV